MKVRGVTAKEEYSILYKDGRRDVIHILEQNLTANFIPTLLEYSVGTDLVSDVIIEFYKGPGAVRLQ